MASKQVLILPPGKSPVTGRQLSWGFSHALDCPWANGVINKGTHWTSGHYKTVLTKDVPAHVGRCSHCGGGR